MVEKAREQGLIVITAGKGDVVRLVPPLIITDADVDTAVGILSSVINGMHTDASTLRGPSVLD